MNPHASYKCAARLLMALAAMTSILLISGCGNSSSSTPPPNPTGFTTSSLSGTYVISVSGTDVNTTASEVGPFAIVGTIVANGSGGITGGTVDINDPVNTGVNIGTAVSSSSGYQIGQDGRGTATIVTSAATFDFDFVLTSTSNGLISRFDDSATNIGAGSGTIDLQSSATQSSFTALSFSLSGADTNGSLASVGTVTLNTSGTIASGTEDFNENGSSSVSTLTGLPVTGGQVVLASSGTSGTALLDSSFGPGAFAFDVWVIDATHVKWIETDTSTSGVLLSGDAFTQQTSFPVGQVVFTLSGQDASENPFVAGGYATATSSGALNPGLEDYNDNGTSVTGRSFTATATTATPGRYQITTNGFGNASVGNLAFAAYPSSGGVLMLEDDNNGLALGTAYAQTATSFNASGGYGLNLSGSNNVNPNINGYAEVDDIAQFDASSAVAPAANMTGTLDENDLAYQLVSAAFSGVYTPDTNSDGRGSIVATTTGTLIGGLTLEYYVVDGSNILFIEQDANQISTGTFQPQSSSSASAAVSHRASSMVRSVVRPHVVLRRK